MTPGTVMFHSDFVFHDSSKARKLFIILGNKGDRFLVAKTTSQQSSKSLTLGCNSSDRFHNFYIPAGTGFKKDTWICLHEFYEFSLAELTQLKDAGTIWMICTVPQQTIIDLKDCAQLSDDISNDQSNLLT